MKKKTEKATFAAGCFWGVEEAFRQLPGVLSTRVGYTGGEMKAPTYEQVCADNTGHAEAVEVTFDPAQISYSDLLEKFWMLHDPTQVDRQGPDVGSQYRSVIFYHSPAQQTTAETSKSALMNQGRQIATEIVKAADFFEAEEYHQQYLAKRGQQICHI